MSLCSHILSTCVCMLVYGYDWCIYFEAILLRHALIVYIVGSWYDVFTVHKSNYYYYMECHMQHYTLF